MEQYSTNLTDKQWQFIEKNSEYAKKKTKNILWSNYYISAIDI